jgi:hypothetical protein
MNEPVKVSSQIGHPAPRALSDWDTTRTTLERAYPKPEDIPVVRNIDAAVLAAIEAGGVLHMAFWHGPFDRRCGTMHCRAGWAVYLAGEKGKALQDKVGPYTAGLLIYRASRPGQPDPDFFAPKDEALADIRKCASEQTS